ncbi:MAG: hypothetical protein AAGC46_14425 [Solirubrobacteraceae bacterium]|nr:hypothetical protein [Patulibacter sp.]
MTDETAATDTQPPAAETSDAEKTRLRRESASYRTKLRAAEAREQELLNAGKSDLERAQGENATLTTRVAELQREIDRRDAASAAGLDAEWAGRLSGTTPEELLEDAKALAAKVGEQKTKADPPSFDQGRNRGDTPQDFNSVLRAAARG